MRCMRRGNFIEIMSHFKEIYGIFMTKSKKFELCVVETLIGCHRVCRRSLN